MYDRVIVTGGAGFIGRALVRQLVDQNVKVCVFDKKAVSKWESKCDYVKVNLMDEESIAIHMKEYRPNAIIHLAARTDVNGLDVTDYAENHIGTRGLIKVVNDKLGSGTRVVFASTQHVCRPGAFKDMNSYDPYKAYGESKMLMEQAIKTSQLKKLDNCEAHIGLWTYA